MKYLSITFILITAMSGGANAQRPGRPGPPPIGLPAERPPRPEGRPDDARGPKGGWLRSLDANSNGMLDGPEFQDAVDRTFSEFDGDGNGAISPEEFPRRARGPEPRGSEAKRLLPPFFFGRVFEAGTSVSKADFGQAALSVFAEMDKNSDGAIGPAEERPPFPPREVGERPRPPQPPNAMFVAAELRFGDRLVKDAPFSADIEIEDTRRLFDGSIITKKISGAIYRDTAGRTRREQPIDVAGVSVTGSDGKPQMLVFINDFTARTQYFLDAGAKVARKSPIEGGGPAFSPRRREDENLEDLGTKVIEGLKVSGTRTTFEIPAGEVGGPKPVKVVTENWFSAELQMIVYSKHTDPLAGEHVFRLVNIRRAEPAASLFEVPAGYQLVGRGRE